MNRWQLLLYTLLLLVLTGLAWRAPAPTASLSNECLNLPEEYFNYANIELPPHLQLPNLQTLDNTPADNPITDAGATLGRVLFYDTKLSANETVACASCHKQALAFTDEAILSAGFEGGLTGRNSMSLAMARFFATGHFFWDERAATLEDQTLMPIQDPVEMGMSLEELGARLGNTEYYPPLFEAAFGTSEITASRMALAMAQFIRSMVSFQSKYDLARLAAPDIVPVDPLPGLTPQENLGKAIFFGPSAGNCAACHGTEGFVAFGAFNNGLDLEYTDPGKAGNTFSQLDVGLFKVPSLRNVALTAPYMHDGRFETLEEVVNHYDTGLAAHPNLSQFLRVGGPNGPPRHLNLSAEEKAGLIAFLNTLTDTIFITDERWSNPFCTDPVFTIDPVKQDGWQAFPNPAADFINIRIDAPLGQDFHLKLLAADGRLVFSGSFTGPVFQLARKDWPAGLYYLQLSEGSRNWVKEVVWK